MSAGNTTLDERLEQLIEVLLALARQNFAARVPVSAELDAIDAIATGINLLAEELDGAVASRHEVERAYQALKLAQAQLVQAGKLAAIGEISSGVAHEINNPAGWVLLSLAVAERELTGARGLLREPTLPREDLRQRLVTLETALADAREGMERISMVAGDLRTFARMDGEQFEPLDLNEVVRVSCRLTAPAYRSRARLTLELAPGASVRGNRGRLGQVVTNLVVNAAQALGEDSERQLIIVGTQVHDQEVLLFVEDGGPGIALELRERVFEPFFTTKPSHVGTGLGLALVRDIVVAHGGRVVVGQSRLGGARIEVSLPHSGDAVTTSLPPAAERQEPRRPRVLVVDDELMLLKALRSYLSAAAEVELAEGGQAALTLIEESAPFDLMLCDLHMPGMDGIDVYRRVQSSFPHLLEQFVFMTGGALTLRAREFLDHERPKLLHKPIDARMLSSLLAKAGQRAESRADRS